MMRYFLMTLITLFGVSIINVAYAGQCIKQRVDSEIIENSDIIFEGRLSENPNVYQDVPRKKEEENISEPMVVLKLWKGDNVEVGDDVIISQNYYHAVGIYAGKNYIVFGRGGTNSIYFVSGCGPTDEIENFSPAEIGLLGSNRLKN